MASVKLSGQLPKGELLGIDKGLADLLAGEPDTQFMAVVLLEVKTVADERDQQRMVVTLRARRIEAIKDEQDALMAQRLMLRASQARSGEAQLPFDEDDLAAAFAEYAQRDPDGDEGAREPEPARGLAAVAEFRQAPAADVHDADTDPPDE